MSILIPNMTIPKDCDECPFRWPHLAHCSITGKSTSHYPTGKEIKGKPNYCPLVDLVRCKECKHNYNTAINHGKMQPRCDFTDWKLSENDYCSRGEREGE